MAAPSTGHPADLLPGLTVGQESVVDEVAARLEVTTGTAQRFCDAAAPLLEELRLATGLTVDLALADGVDVVFLGGLHPTPGVVNERHRRLPAHTDSAGKALAAFDPALARARAVAGLPRSTDRTIDTLEEWDRALAEVRRLGYAVSADEHEFGLASLAAPVLDGTGRPRAAVWLAGPSDLALRSVPRTARLVRLIADRLARPLGG